MTLLKKFGQVVKKQRKEKKISQNELAEMTELHRTYISNVERGEKNISLKNIERIAKALNVKIRDLFYDL